jgi:hypothetical protein
MKGSTVFMIAFALIFYSTGAAFIESFVNYSSWHLIGPAEFSAFHKFITPRVLALLVLPAALGTVFSILMLWFRPASIPIWSVWLVIALQMVLWVSSVTIQIPIQLKLQTQGLSIPLVDHLIVTNWWLRRVPYAITAALFLWMMVIVLGKGKGGGQAV